MPGSNWVLEYKASPWLFLGPAKTVVSTVFWPAVRQLPSRGAPLQLGTSVCRLNTAWQAATSCIWPSVTPSSALHLARILAPTILNSAAVTAVGKTDWPLESSEVMLVSDRARVLANSAHDSNVGRCEVAACRHGIGS